MMGISLQAREAFGAEGKSAFPDSVALTYLTLRRSQLDRGMLLSIRDAQKTAFSVSLEPVSGKKQSAVLP